LISPAVAPGEATLYAELWVSLASLLRSYTALHGLNRKQQATVELGEDLIVVRAGEKWLRLARQGGEFHWSREDASQGLLWFTVDGRLETRAGEANLDLSLEEMDMQAESWARELMQ
jgi:hypothetical protein